MLPWRESQSAGRRWSAAATLCLAGLAGCREGVLDAVNHAPLVHSIIATPTVVLSQQDVILRAEATDEDGDGIRYFWSAPAGAFDGVIGESVRWTAPRTPGDYEVQVNASDRVSSTTATVRLRVVTAPVR
jgi:hypothetical protein